MTSDSGGADPTSSPCEKANDMIISGGKLSVLHVLLMYRLHQETDISPDLSLIKYSTLVGAVVKKRPGPIPQLSPGVPEGQFTLHDVVAEFSHK